MNKVLTSILIILILLILVIMLIFKYKSLSNLEKENIDSEPIPTKTTPVDDRSEESPTKPKRNQSQDPGDLNSLYSKLKANITEDDVLVTGGYKADNGNMRYSFIQAEAEDHNGKKMVKIRIKNIEISPETANDSNLDYLGTNKSRIFDHFGVLSSEEHKETVNRLNEKGMQVLALPQIGLIPGQKGQLYMGDDKTLKQVDISVKSTILKDGSFDIELEAKQNRN